MISLNRPYAISPNNSERLSVNYGGIAQAWEERGMVITSSSREGLSRIYRQLYEERGAMRVAVSPLTCFIAIYPLVANGHIPVFVDIDPLTLNMSEEALMAHEDVDAVQVIYLGGNPMRMDKVMAWAKERGVVVIEDCAQALGAKWNGQEVGTFGEYAVASAVKNLYSVAGGLLVGEIRSESGWLRVKSWLMVYKRLKRWLERKTNACKGNIWNPIYGGLLKLKDTRDNGFANCIHRVPEKVEKEIREAMHHAEDIQTERMRKVERLIAQIDRAAYVVQQVPKGGDSTRNRVIVVVQNREAREVIAALRAKGIAANNLTQSYTHSYQEHVRTDEMIGKYYTEMLPNYERILPRVVSVPCSPALANKEIDYITEILNTL